MHASPRARHSALDASRTFFYTPLFAFYEFEIPMTKWEIYEFGNDPPVRLVSEGLDSKSASQIGPLQFMVERS